MKAENIDVSGARLRGQEPRETQVGRAERVSATLAAWRERMGQRAELIRRARTLKRDTAITDADIWRETRKWFWQR